MAEETPIVRAYRLDDYAVIQLLVSSAVVPDKTVEITGVGNGFNDNDALVVACPQYRFIGVNVDTGGWNFDYSDPVPNQVMYQNVGDDVDIYAVNPYGTMSYGDSHNWITGQELATYLGLTYASDSAFFTQCAAAASHFCYRRRLEAGYLQDTSGTAPSEDVKTGTLMVGMAIYRQRGSIDTFASFTDMGAPQTFGLAPLAKQLLGIPRPAVA